MFDEPAAPRARQSPARPDPVETADPEPCPHEAELAELTEKLAHQRELTRAHEIKAAQAAEDIERAKERIEREAARTVQQNRRAFLESFLDVLDDLDRALDAAPAEGDLAMREGVELVRKRFLSTLADHGVSYAPVLGQRFDPTRHDAVTAVPVTDPNDEGLIVSEIRKGYRIGDDVLRAARVAVGKYTA